jgi:hypothetical protein
MENSSITSQDKNNDDYNEQDRIMQSSADNLQDGQRGKKKKLKKGERTFYPPGPEKLTAHVFELTLVRTKSVHESLMNLIQPLKDAKKLEENEGVHKKIKRDLKKLEKQINPEDLEKLKLIDRLKAVDMKRNNEIQKEKERKRIQKVKDQIYNSKIEFELKPVRKFENLDKYFGNSLDPIITDLGTLALCNNEEHRLFYEQIELTSFIENQLGEDDEFKKFKVADYQWKVLKTGFLGYRLDRIYYINLDVKLDIVENQYKIDVGYSKTIPMSCLLGEGELVVSTVYG